MDNEGDESSSPVDNPLHLPQKREVSEDIESLSEQPTPKRSSNSVAVIAPPTSTPAVNASNPHVNSPTSIISRILQRTQNLFGQSNVELAELFVRNEPALANTVEDLRRVLQFHQGHMDDNLEEFREALGPRRTSSEPSLSPNSTTPSSSMSISAPLAPASIVMTDRAARDILQSLGRILELHAILIKKIMTGNPSNPDDVDNNRIAYVYGQVMQQLGDMLQYTFRSKLVNVEKNLNQQVQNWQTRLHTIVDKVKALNDRAVLDSDDEGEFAKAAFTEIVQPSPPTIYRNVEDPNLRYRINVAEVGLTTEAPELILGEDDGIQDVTLTRGEENLLLRFGNLELLNGTKKTQVNYSIHGMQFCLCEFFSSEGWIDQNKSKPQGKFIRTLEFDFSNFQERSEGYIIGRRSWNSGRQQQTSIIVSGIVNEEGSEYPLRIEFVFVLPPHLGVNHVNDVGVRDEVLKVQFSK